MVSLPAPHLQMHILDPATAQQNFHDLPDPFEFGVFCNIKELVSEIQLTAEETQTSLTKVIGQKRSNSSHSCISDAQTSQVCSMNSSPEPVVQSGSGSHDVRGEIESNPEAESEQEPQV